MGNKSAPLSVMLTVKDMAKSIAFYRDVCGFELKEKWPDTDAPMWANLMLGEQSVMIGPAMNPDGDHGCGEMDATTKAFWSSAYADWQKNKPGVGVCIYLAVDAVDAHHDRVVTKGVNAGKPTSQFYGIRDYWVEDPNGYRLQFYTPIAMTSCQSCGMPLKDAKPGAMYCQYCTDEKGQLRPYETVLEGTTQGYFMAMQKMPRPQAEKAAREHLAKMPAWMHRK
jgi:uncharacterized glyoxalase superfamily protein PhnB